MAGTACRQRKGLRGMARTGSKNLIDDKITKAQDAVVRAKTRYEAALADLENLMIKKEEMKKEELYAAIGKSSKSYDEIMRFLGENIR